MSFGLIQCFRKANNKVANRDAEKSKSNHNGLKMIWLCCLFASVRYKRRNSVIEQLPCMPQKEHCYIEKSEKKKKVWVVRREWKEWRKRKFLPSRRTRSKWSIRATSCNFTCIYFTLGSNERSVLAEWFVGCYGYELPFIYFVLNQDVRHIIIYIICYLSL